MKPRSIVVVLGILFFAGSPAWAQLEEKYQTESKAQDLKSYFSTLGTQKKVATALQRKVKPGGLEGANPLTPLQVAPGNWWTDANMASLLNLTKEQQKRMDEVFQQFRLKLIDLNASLAKEEAILEPMIGADTLDEAKILTQIDRIAGTRADLEKANARMLLGIRQSLTQEQWDKLPQKNPKKKPKP